MKYAVFLQGENFAIPTNEKSDLVGFFATKVVDANTESNAKDQAIALVKKDPKVLEAFSKSKSINPTLNIMVAHELFEGSRMTHTKYTYYAMEEE